MTPSVLRRLILASLCLPLAASLAAAPARAQTGAAATEEQIAAGAPPEDLTMDSWRFLDGPGVVGVMRLIREPGARALGFFVVQVDSRGVFEGVYNLKEDGRAVVGMFWPEGKLNEGSVSGFLDIDAEGAASVSFTAGGAVGGLKAR